MPKYKANAHVLGLSPKETFTSDDPFYDQFEQGGFLTIVDDDGDGSGGDDDDDRLETPPGEPGLGSDLGNEQDPD